MYIYICIQYTPTYTARRQQHSNFCVVVGANWSLWHKRDYYYKADAVQEPYNVPMRRAYGSSADGGHVYLNSTPSAPFVLTRVYRTRNARQSGLPLCCARDILAQNTLLRPCVYIHPYIAYFIILV